MDPDIVSSVAIATIWILAAGAASVACYVLVDSIFAAAGNSGGTITKRGRHLGDWAATGMAIVAIGLLAIAVFSSLMFSMEIFIAFATIAGLA